MSSVKRQVRSLLQDAKDYLKQIADSDYSSQLDVLSGSSIGQHTRHFIEFFQCVLSCGQQNEDGVAIINYDKRKRDSCIECDTLHVIRLLESLEEEISAVDLKEQVWLAHTDYGSGEVNLIPSSIERELFYNVEHTIHHFALIKIGLQQLSTDLHLPAHFGVAPSTLAFRNSEAVTH